MDGSAVDEDATALNVVNATACVGATAVLVG